MRGHLRRAPGPTRRRTGFGVDLAGPARRARGAGTALAALGAAALALAGSVTAQEAGPAPVVVRMPLAAAGVRDARAPYRARLCAVLRASSDPVARDWPCERALVRLPDEAAAPGAEGPPAPAPRRRFTVIHVLGLGGDCAGQADWVENELRAHVQGLGHDYRLLRVEGLSSSTSNARRLRDALAGPAAEGPGGAGRDVVLFGHSKGAVDALEMLVDHPEVRPRVAALLSLAGAVGGSPLADLPPDGALEIAARAPGASCEVGDLGALRSLRPAVRHDWLARHRLPAQVRYYSIVAQPSPPRVSIGLTPTWRLLARIDPRNDGQLLAQDQVIPGGALLAVVDADHWAISTNLQASPSLLVRAAANRNDFPRRAMLEAALWMIADDLAADEPGAAAPAR
jgi:hypothetical protein